MKIYYCCARIQLGGEDHASYLVIYLQRAIIIGLALD